MKKNYKIIAAIISVLLIFSLTACKSSKEILVSSSPASSENSSETVSSEESKTEVVSEPEPPSEPETPSEPENPSEPEPVVSTPEPVVSQPAIPSVPEVSVPKVPTAVTITPEFTVNDPENVRGLSETRMGYGHGEQVSIDNQNKFNSMSGVEALARDIVTGENCIYLTFDCGYEYNNLTASILDTLKEKNVKAAFFCTLSYLKQNPQLVWRMINEGHIVGNHSATHPVFPTITRTQMAKELYDVHKYLQKNFGYTPKYFRFPTGAYSESALELVTSVGYKSIFWSFAYRDWETNNQPEPTAALERIKGAFYPGSVPLLHAVSKTNTNLLPQIIDYGIAQGYTFATLDDYYN